MSLIDLFVRCRYLGFSLSWKRGRSLLVCAKSYLIEFTVKIVRGGRESERHGTHIGPARFFANKKAPTNCLIGAR